MAFHKEIRDYRMNILSISQEEASKRLHMTQPALSQYESGARDIPIRLIPLFQRVYNIPYDHLINMLFSDEVEPQYSPMVLREHANDKDIEKVLQLLEKQPKLLHFLVSLTHSDERTQNNFIDFFPHLRKFVKNNKREEH